MNRKLNILLTFLAVTKCCYLMTLVLAEGLVKNFGSVVAVDDLSLKVKKSSVMGIIGPNGAGKTTTIRMLLGLLKPDKGHVEVFGEDPWDQPGIRSRIGVVYEKAYFPPHQRSIDYLEKVCRIFGVPESRAREVMATAGLEDARDRIIKGLSAGMLQKFAVAHALIHEPEFIVADEPTANLDPQARSDLLDLILRLHRDENTTFLISSHILPELSRVCESVAIVSRGKVWASGGLIELYEKYAARSTRILTDKPDALAKELENLKYVRKVEVDSRSVSVGAVEGKEDELYVDAPRLARKLGAKILGIESGTASLEELFRLAVKADM
jgi:ABC-2 type transport system ATP-binding protein